MNDAVPLPAQAAVVAWLATTGIALFATMARVRWAGGAWILAAVLWVAMAAASPWIDPEWEADAESRLSLALWTVLYLAATIAMGCVARHRAEAPATADPFPHWEAATWAFWLPVAAGLVWLLAAGVVMLPLGFAVHELATSQWLFDQCTAGHEVGDATLQPLCDAAEGWVAYWWLIAMIVAGTAWPIAAAWLVFRIAPRGRRWRLAGFAAAVAALEWAILALASADGGLLVLAALSLLMAIVAFIAFRSPNRRSPPSPPAAPPA